MVVGLLDAKRTAVRVRLSSTSTAVLPGAYPVQPIGKFLLLRLLVVLACLDKTRFALIASVSQKASERVKALQSSSTAQALPRRWQSSCLPRVTLALDCGTHTQTHTHTHPSGRVCFVWADRLAAWVVSALIATDTVCASAALRLEWFGVNVNGCVSLLPPPHLGWASAAVLRSVSSSAIGLESSCASVGS